MCTVCMFVLVYALACAREVRVHVKERGQCQMLFFSFSTLLLTQGLSLAYSLLIMLDLTTKELPSLLAQAKT